jgi:hypothetical protein
VRTRPGRRAPPTFATMFALSRPLLDPISGSLRRGLTAPDAARGGRCPRAGAELLEAAAHAASRAHTAASLPRRRQPSHYGPPRSRPPLWPGRAPERDLISALSRRLDGPLAVVRCSAAEYVAKGGKPTRAGAALNMQHMAQAAIRSGSGAVTPRFSLTITSGARHRATRGRDRFDREHLALWTTPPVVNFRIARIDQND